MIQRAWSLCSGRVPQLSDSAIEVTIAGGFRTSGVKVWTPYVDDDIECGSIYEQSTNICSVFVCFCELAKIINKSLELLHSPRQNISNAKILAVHAQYLHWYESIPSALKHGQDFTPAVLTLQ